MAYVHIPTRGEGTSAEVFKSVPAHVKGYLQEGLKTFGGLPETGQDEVLKFAKEAVRSAPGRYGFSTKALATGLGLSEEAANAVFAFVSLALFVLSAPTTPSNTAEGFVKAGVDAGVIGDDLKEVAAKVANQAVADRESVRISASRASLANKTLPTLVDFDASIDMRLAFDKSQQIKDAVPVAVMRVADDLDEQMTFQMTRQQLETMARDLQQMVRQFEQADKVAEGIRPSGAS